MRDRRARNAAREGRPAAGLIATLLDDLDRRRRVAAVRAAYALADAAYRTEVDEWARLSDDGLTRTDRVLRGDLYWVDVSPTQGGEPTGALAGSAWSQAGTTAMKDSSPRKSSALRVYSTTP